ncbi:MAG: MBL fold metallo-hydrolase [Lachnospiraceae bacterium]|nr:MBL fold metallo-hydrolase [Lachnospiraceae bacterium]
MKITFLGAAHEVTGSMTYIEAGGHRVLVDCGMEQGKDIFVNQSLPIPASEVEAVFLTHAHIDHSGNLPLLYKHGFRGPVYTTEATLHLCQIMLLDSAAIQESEVEWQNRKNDRAGRPMVEPVYTQEDAKAVLQQFIPLSYGEQKRVLENMEVRFGDAGHLLGAAHIELWVSEEGITKKLLFSGDVGNLDRPLIQNPQPVEEADYVVLESTYGNRLHEPHEGHDAYVLQLSRAISRVLGRGGNLVVPAFAVGRTQELLYFIRQIKEENLVPELPHFKVVLDSPLAVEATAVFQQTPPEYFDEEARALLAQGINPVFFDDFYLSVSSEESKEINFDPEPKVIISASGMCEAGRIRHHLKHNLWRPESGVLFVGYQTEGTLGRLLLDGAETVKLFGEEISVQAELITMQGISGHADRDGLAAWLNGLKEKPERVFINHGDPEVCDSFAAWLKEEYAYDTLAPYSGAVYDLLTGECLVQAVGIPVEKKESGGKEGEKREKSLYASLLSAGERLLSLIKGMKERSNTEIKKMISEIDKIISKYS